MDDDQYKKYMKQCMKYPIAERKIVFRTYANYADHEKYITEALIKQTDELDIVWLVSDAHTMVLQGVRLVYAGNRKQVIYEMVTAKIWVSDLPIFEYIEKRIGQIYIQTKHWASITLKKFYMDTRAFDNEPKKLALWKREQRMIDYILVGSEFDKESCRRGFGKNDGFVEVGSPRSDAMFQLEACRSKVCEQFKLASTCKILLYAPTYCFDAEKENSVHQSKNIEMDFERVRMALQHRFGGDWNILLRLHPSVRKEIRNMKLPDFIIDASEYVDSQELVAAADITVSDYSSIMFEPAFALKPVCLFATDMKEYIANEFELLIDYDTLPFPIAETNDELVRNIENFDKEVYEQNVTLFLDKYGVHEDGHASERAAQFISSLIGE
ncbi:MAG: CDP-glycerol glycerophosphotransferase family protein [Lachnospiraceae bacterium]|nr:CDP-glycerol glycerophosphotransferase family protein [Lachnospiraceae bacterium]